MEIVIEKMLEEHLNNLDLNEFDDFWNMNILRQDLNSDNSIYIVAKCNNEIARLCWDKHYIRRGTHCKYSCKKR